MRSGDGSKNLQKRLVLTAFSLGSLLSDADLFSLLKPSERSRAVPTRLQYGDHRSS